MRHIDERHVLALIAVLLLPILCRPGRSRPIHALAGSASEIVPSGPSYIGAPQESYQLFVFGDSLAAGSVFRHEPHGGGRFAASPSTAGSRTIRAWRRPEFYDWAAALPKIHERREIDIAVILLGSNDGQDIRSISGPIQFGTPEWASTYAQRVDDMIRILKAARHRHLLGRAAAHGSGAARSGGELRCDHAARPGRMREKIRYIETRKIFSDATGRYTDQGTDVNGKAMRLRARDGIHFLKSGNNKLGLMSCLQAIRRDIAIGGRQGARSFVSPHSDFPSSAGADRGRCIALPVFGQMSGSKEEAPSRSSRPIRNGHRRCWRSAAASAEGQCAEHAANGDDCAQGARAAAIDGRPPAHAGQWPEAKDGRL